MYFVDKHQIAVLVGAEFVLGIHEDEPAARRQILTAHKELVRNIFHTLVYIGRNKSLSNEVLRRKWSIVLFLLRRRIEYRVWQFLVFAHALRKLYVAKAALSSPIACPD